MPYYYVPGPGASEAATGGGHPAGYAYPLETDMSMYSPRPYVNYVNYRPYPVVAPNPVIDTNRILDLAEAALNRPRVPLVMPQPRRAAPPSNQNNQNNQNNQATPPANQNQQNQQTSPGVYNGRVRVGDDLRLSDVSQGGFPPVPPTPAAPAAPAPSPMEDPMGLLSLNEWLSSGYAGAPDLVGSPDPEVVQDPATVAPAPDVSQRTSVSLPSSPVASQAEFMTQAEAAPLAQDNAVNTQSLSDASGIVQDMVRAYMAPYYNLYRQGAALGSAIGRELRNPTVPQAGVTPIPGVAAPAVIVP